MSSDIFVTCRVPRDMTVLSNGRRIGESYDPKTGLKAVTWAQEKPHVNYLISLVAGYFKSITQKHGDISMSFWTPPSNSARQLTRLGDETMHEFMEKDWCPLPVGQIRSGLRSRL